MKFPVKLAIGSGGTLVFIVLIGFVIFPKMITSKIKSVSLKCIKTTFPNLIDLIYEIK